MRNGRGHLAGCWARINFSSFATLLGFVRLILGLVIAIDLPGAPDPYVVANLSPLVVPTLVIGLVTLALQLRGGWLAVVGILDFIVGDAYLLTTIGSFHYRSPLPGPSSFKVIGLGVLLGAFRPLSGSVSRRLDRRWQGDPRLPPHPSCLGDHHVHQYDHLSMRDRMGPRGHWAGTSSRGRQAGKASRSSWWMSGPHLGFGR